ncbi:hypothetical protein FB451DRAFT_1164855 [Mycena latifolia]|nr:hypothetical protein FB451DRAFT_1164855 [Mycena latifolia]
MKKGLCTAQIHILSSKVPQSSVPSLQIIAFRFAKFKRYWIQSICGANGQCMRTPEKDARVRISQGSTRVASASSGRFTVAPSPNLEKKLSAHTSDYDLHDPHNYCGLDGNRKSARVMLTILTIILSVAILYKALSALIRPYDKYLILYMDQAAVSLTIGQKVHISTALRSARIKQNKLSYSPRYQQEGLTRPGGGEGGENNKDGKHVQQHWHE